MGLAAAGICKAYHMARVVDANGCARTAAEGAEVDDDTQPVRGLGIKDKERCRIQEEIQTLFYLWCFSR